MQSIKIKTKEAEVVIEVEGTPIVVGNAAKAASEATLEWSKTLCNGKSVTYEEAEKAIKELGAGWRLPTRQELESILDLSRHDPAIDTERFPDTQSTYYWTSTPCAWNKTSAVWFVGFGSGGVHNGHRNDLACVRAVRAGQSL